jgi:hypothetical protein
MSYYKLKRIFLQEEREEEKKERKKTLFHYKLEKMVVIVDSSFR